MTQPEDAKREEIIHKRLNNVGKLARQLSRDFSDRALKKLREHGYDNLTPFHTTLISNLDVEGTRLSTLAERAEMSKQAMSQIANDLEKQGYITRSPDPADKRAALILFTDAGWEFLQVAYDLKLEIESEYSQIIGEEGMQQLQELLAALINPDANTE